MIGAIGTPITAVTVQQPGPAKPAAEAGSVPSTEGRQPASIEETGSQSPPPPLSPEAFQALLQAQESAQSSVLNPNDLTPEEKEIVEELKQTDREVRAHEQAHKTVGGPYAGSVSFETVTGPDGREYAVAGEVDIDVSPVAGNPEATIRKMEVVIRAALAPAEPSPQDVQIAQTAQQIKLQAQIEKQKMEQAEQDERKDETELFAVLVESEQG